MALGYARGSSKRRALERAVSGAPAVEANVGSVTLDTNRHWAVAASGVSVTSVQPRCDVSAATSSGLAPFSKACIRSGGSGT